jgi:serine phosphatase RsbU (regulator of sigma subunit)
MSSELDIARGIQQGLLPQYEPEIPNLDIAGICLTYAEVGGDYYDYLPLKDGRLVIALGDVFGHGLASGLLAAAVRGCLHNQVRIDPKASEVLTALDEAVRSSGDQLMTLVYSILDPHTGSVIAASAGHWAPSHYLKQTNEVKELYLSTSIAPALGAFPTDVYPEHRTTLGPGDILAFYSDGILEALGPDGEMYGEERFHKALCRYAEDTAQEIRDAILNEVSELHSDASQDDDIALVIVKYNPSNGGR